MPYNKHSNPLLHVIRIIIILIHKQEDYLQMDTQTEGHVQATIKRHAVQLTHVFLFTSQYDMVCGWQIALVWQERKTIRSKEDRNL